MAWSVPPVSPAAPAASPNRSEGERALADMLVGGYDGAALEAAALDRRGTFCRQILHRSLGRRLALGAAALLRLHGVPPSESRVVVRPRARGSGSSTREP